MQKKCFEWFSSQTKGECQEFIIGGKNQDVEMKLARKILEQISPTLSEEFVVNSNR